MYMCRLLCHALPILLLACEPGKPIDSAADPPDHDGDGATVLTDCDDDDPAVSPLAQEEPYDDIDNDCTLDTPDDDLDGDGALLGVDCNDGDADIGPGVAERCNGIDDDCDGETDEDALDVSIDETCGDGLDNNCDGTADDCARGGEYTLEEADATWLGERYGDLTAAPSAPADLDGDGFDDLIAARCADDACTGEINVFAGPVAGTLTGADAFVTITGERDYDGYGWTSIGDLNGDGHADLAVSRFHVAPGNALISVILGPFSSGRYTLAETDAQLLCDSAREGRATVASMRIGDLDGDGQPDLLESHTWTDEVTWSYVEPGLLTVTLGPLEPGDTPLTDAAVAIEGDDDSVPLWQGRFAGDPNGDGVPDLVVGAADTGEGAGTVYLLLGPVEVSAIADADMALMGEAAGDGLGLAIESAGDSDDDGLDDLWIAAALADTDGDGSGDARLHHGSATGLESTPAATVSGQAGRGVSSLATGEFNGDGARDLALGDMAYDAPGTVALVYAPFAGARGVTDADARLVGAESADYFGAYYLYTGDPNSDELDDVVVSAYALDNYRGGVFLYNNQGL